MAPKPTSTPAMDLAALAVLGLNPEDIQDRVIERICDRLLEDVFSDEDGEGYSRRSSFREKLDKEIKKRVDGKIEELAKIHLHPMVNERIDTVMMERTNTWGEKTGEERMGFVAYLATAADAYMREEVDYRGRSRDECIRNHDSFKKDTTRISYAINEHLRYSIDTAMKSAMAKASETVKGGLVDACKVALENVVQNVQVTIKTDKAR